MKASPVRFLATRLLVGRRDPSGRKDLARRALRGAVLSVALSLVPLITVMEVADGMIQGISSRYVELGTYHAQAHSYSSSADWPQAKAAVLAMPGVRGAWLETQSVGVAFANGRREGASIRAVEPEFLLDRGSADYLQLESGSLAMEGANDVLVGSAMAAKLGLSSGDTVNLITIRRSADGEPVPRVAIMRVSGIVSAGYRELDSQWLFMRQDMAARYLPRESSRTILGVKSSVGQGGTDPFAYPDRLAEDLRQVLPIGFTTYSWRSLQLNLFESLSSTRTLLLLIMAITVAVASVNVSSALTTLVTERSQEIAILKSVGARPEDLARTFSMGGAFLGAAGAILGAAGGLLASVRINEIIHGFESVANGLRALFAGASGTTVKQLKLLDPGYYLERIPISVSFPRLAVVVGATVMLAFLAALLPARRAAALDPMEVFRKR